MTHVPSAVLNRKAVEEDLPRSKLAGPGVEFAQSRQATLCIDQHHQLSIARSRLRPLHPASVVDLDQLPDRGALAWQLRNRQQR